MRSRREIPRGSQFVQWGVHKQASRIYRAVCATIIIIIIIIIIIVVVVVIVIIIIIYSMACVCRRYDARSDWLIVSPVMPTGRLRACARTIGCKVITSAAFQ